jgi:uncharacterized protein (TIGR03437 family)
MPTLSRRPVVISAISALSLTLLFLLACLIPMGASSRPLPARRSAKLLQASSPVRLQELEAKLRDPRFLLLRVAIFDPLESEPEPVRIGQEQLETTSLPARTASLAAITGQAAEATQAYFIVQYHDRIKPEWTERLRASGYEIVGYLPNNAYIIRAPLEHQPRLQLAQSRGEFRWVGAYGRGLKVETELQQLADEIASGFITGDEPDSVAVSFITFRGEGPASVQQLVSQFNLAVEPIIEQRSDGRVWGLLWVARKELPRLLIALASLEGIEWIQRRPPRRLLNDNGIRVVQTGTVSTDTPLYRHGLTGAGQIVALADSGLDADHAQFRLSSQTSAQTLSFAVTSNALVNGALPVNVTNPNNKVIAYYLLGAGNLIDNAANPHGGKTLDPDQKSGGNFLNSVAYDDTEGVYHGTHTASIIAGRDFNADSSGAVPGLPGRTSGDGVAPDARIVFQDVGHPSGTLPGVNFISQALIHSQAYMSGARIHSNSYGLDPPVPYDEDASDIDEIMWKLRDYTIFFAAGNNEAGTMKLANSAKNNLIVAATESLTNGGNIENIASYSNHGPTLDGRLKPDIAAPGTLRAATESGGIASSFGEATSRTARDAAVNPTDPNNNRNLSNLTGTSFSTPLVAGAAVLVRQYYVDGYYPGGVRNVANSFIPSNALIKATILNSGRNMTGIRTASDGTGGASAPLPNFGQGWGRIALDDALFFPGDRRELKVIADILNGATAPETARPAPNPAIQTGQIHTYQLTNVSTVEPLRITLVWSDPRGALGAQTALVNNLDLEVIDPQGTVYRGNVNFENAYSRPANNAPFDNKNPVEAVYIRYPQPGTYTIRVIGENVPGNGQMQVLAQPGNQMIDSNRQGYALIATGNFTAGAQAVIDLTAANVSGGVTFDRFISRNETVTATIAVTNQTVVAASNVNVQLAVDQTSQVPASLIRINGRPAGQSVTVNYGDLSPLASRALAFQITLLDDGNSRTGQQLRFNVTITPANGPVTTTQFAITVSQRLITYRTRFEPAPDPGGPGIIVIPESAWGLRPDNPAPAPSNDAFAGPWRLTTGQHSENGASTASLSDPSGVGASYGTSSTSRSNPAGIYDDTRYWTAQKILLPGLNVDQTTGRVTNPALTAQLNAAIDSFELDVKADFTGDTLKDVSGDFFIFRVRPYRNTASVRSTDDSGFNDQSFTNLMIIDSSEGPTSGFRRFTGKPFTFGSGNFTVDTVNPDNSDVAFRLELHLRRNDVAQTGEGIFVDNLLVRLRIDDPTVYSPLASNTSASVDAASFVRAAAPGQILAAFGSGFPATTTITAAAPSVPLPTQLANVSVRVNGLLAPLFFVGVGGSFGTGAFQINYQLPYETPPGVALVEVLNNGVPVSSEFLTVSEAAPGVFTRSFNGQGQAAALNQDYSLNGDPNQNPNTRPEARGRIIIIYANGQGGQLVDSVTRQSLALASGAAAPTTPLYVTATDPVVTIGGVPATVAFSGLAPGFVGLWQLNVVIPLSAPTGNAVPMVITMGGRSSLVTTLAIN